MSVDKGSVALDAVDIFFHTGGISPDADVAAAVRADFARLRAMADLVHSVREADELDGLLVFDAAR